MNDPKDLQSIIILPEALNLIERFLISCFEVNLPADRLRFEKKNVVTLEDLFLKAPVLAIKLADLCKDANIDRVGIVEVVDHFVGPSHMEAISGKVDAENYIIAATGQLMSERMKELGIHIESPENKSVFEFMDLALVCHVLTVNHRLVAVRVHGKTIANCVRPRTMRVQKNDWVLLHKGCIVQTIHSDCERRRILTLQEGYRDKYYIRNLLDKTPPIIDFRNFCPSTPEKRNGSDITELALARL
jgi:hypothetical protein